MDIQQVRQRLKGIEQAKDDPEEAHGRQDELYQEVLASIALGNPDPANLAKEALKASDISFPRWYA